MNTADTIIEVYSFSLFICPQKLFDVAFNKVFQYSKQSRQDIFNKGFAEILKKHELSKT